MYNETFASGATGWNGCTHSTSFGGYYGVDSPGDYSTCYANLNLSSYSEYEVEVDLWYNDTTNAKICVSGSSSACNEPYFVWELDTGDSRIKDVPGYDTVNDAIPFNTNITLGMRVNVTANTTTIYKIYNLNTGTDITPINSQPNTNAITQARLDSLRLELGDMNGFGRIMAVRVYNYSTVVPGTVSVALVAPALSGNLTQSKMFNFTTSVTCSGGDCGNVSVYLDPLNISNKVYPLNPLSMCSSTRTCQDVLAIWNNNAWNDTVDESFASNGGIAAVRWTPTEGNCTGYKCTEQAKTDSVFCPIANYSNHQFCGATDELGNVMLSMAMGNNQTKYELLHNFTELLRYPGSNNLQCWAYYVNGSKTYDSYDDICARNDSASDASLRILGAYSIACARQRSGNWSNVSVDYCADYVQQGRAIFGLDTASHGEVTILSTGRAYLANGYNNQEGAPSGGQSFRPDYYELQFLMDYAEYMNNGTLSDYVIDMLEAYEFSLGTNHIHQGKTGLFTDSNASVYRCGELCTPAFMDETDTWRAIPALSGLYVVHGEDIPSSMNATIFSYWWNHYGGGNSTFNATNDKPMQIYSNSSDGLIKASEESYKTLGMWIPLGVAFNSTYVNQSLRQLIDVKYDFSNGNFYGAMYHGAYYTQFAHRAIGVSTGMIDPKWWAPVQSSTSKGGLVSPIVGATPFYTTSSNPQNRTHSSCLQDMLAGSSCTVTWVVNTTGTTGNKYEFYVYTSSDKSGVTLSDSTKINLTIVSSTTIATPQVRVAPTSPTTSTNLLGYCNSSKDAADIITYDYQWYKNNALVASSGYCRQDNATAATACGGLSTGSYSTPDSYLYVNYSKPVFALSSSKWEVYHGYALDPYNITLPDDCWNAYSDKIVLRIQSYITRSQGNNYPSGYSQPACYNGTSWVDVGTSAHVIASPTAATLNSCAAKTYDSNMSTSCAYDSVYDEWVTCTTGTSSSYGCYDANIKEELMHWNISPQGISGVETNLANMSMGFLTSADSWRFSCRATANGSTSNWINSTSVTIS